MGAHRAEQPGINGPIALLWSAAAALVLIAVGIIFSLVLMGRIDLFGGADPAAPRQTQGVLAEIDTSYRVLVLNATSEAGAVETVRQTLIDRGWQAGDVFGSDGSTSEFPETTVFYVEKADEAAALGVAELLGGAGIEHSDHYAALNDSDRPQLTVVIGMDRVGTNSPAPADGQ